VAPTFLLEPLIDVAHPFKGLVPAALKLIGDQAIVGIDGIVLLARALGGIARGFEVHQQAVDHIVLPGGRLGRHHDGGLDRDWLYDTQHLP